MKHDSANLISILTPSVAGVIFASFAVVPLLHVEPLVADAGGF